MLEAGLVPSKGEARRLVTQGGVSVNDEKVTDPAKTFTKADLQDAVIKKGKKNFYKIIIK